MYIIASYYECAGIREKKVILKLFMIYINNMNKYIQNSQLVEKHFFPGIQTNKSYRI